MGAARSQDSASWPRLNAPLRPQMTIDVILNQGRFHFQLGQQRPKANFLTCDLWQLHTEREASCALRVEDKN